MHLNLVPLQESHVEEIEYRESDKTASQYFRELLEKKPDNCKAWALIDEQDKVVAMGGLSFPWPKVADAFMTFSKDVENDSDIALKVFWHIKKIIKSAFETYELHRMQASTPIGYGNRFRWLENLGFEYEGTLKKYSPDGQDFILYGKVK